MGKAFEMDGTIKAIQPTQTFNSGFTKRECIVCDDDGRYPNDIKFVFVKDNCAVLDRFAEKDRVRVTFSIRGNYWQDRLFNDLQAFKIEKLDTDGSTAEPIAVPEEVFEADVITDDDMPF